VCVPLRPSLLPPAHRTWSAAPASARTSSGSRAGARRSSIDPQGSRTPSCPTLRLEERDRTAAPPPPPDSFGFGLVSVLGGWCWWGGVFWPTSSCWHDPTVAPLRALSGPAPGSLMAGGRQDCSLFRDRDRPCDSDGHAVQSVTGLAAVSVV
jgi:hypothetical protein